jgi:hypothetical protein
MRQHLHACRLMPFVIMLSWGTLAAQEVREMPAGPWFHFRRNPSLSVVFGGMTQSVSGGASVLAPLGMAELKLGGVHEDPIGSPGMVDFRYDYITVANISDALGRSVRAGEVGSDIWRFGAAWARGYGYQFADSGESPALILYKCDGLMWSHIDMHGNLAALPDGSLLGQFEDGIRFGTATEAGIRLRIAPLLIIDTGFERSIIFRRHVFWPWIGSVAVEGAGQWLLDRFVDRIMDSSPEAVPVVNFVLKNSLAFAFSQLRRQKMNAPFASEPPLFSEGLKIGITMVF